MEFKVQEMARKENEFNEMQRELARLRVDSKAFEEFKRKMSKDSMSQVKEFDHKYSLL